MIMGMADPARFPATLNPLSVPPVSQAADTVVPGQPVKDTSSRLLRRLRGSFSPTVQKVLHAPTAAVPPATSVAPTPPAAPQNTSEQLAILEKVLDEVAPIQEDAPIQEGAPMQVEQTLVPPPVVPQAGVAAPPVTQPQALSVDAQPVTLPTPPAAQSVDSGVLAQVVAPVTMQATDTLNPAQPVATAKERFEASVSPDTGMVDASGGIQYVESEKSAEIPVEVEQFLKEVTDHQAQLPHEIVLAGETEVTSSVKNTPTTPVVVLPITPQVEDQGARKPIKWSVRWLVEWSRKIMKVFSGKVIYRQQEAGEQP